MNKKHTEMGHRHLLFFDKRLKGFINTYVYSRKGNRGISDIPRRHPHLLGEPDRSPSQV
jgi:hypothetical protein